MGLLPLSLNARDQATVRSIVAFLEGRLEEKETIEWALDLGSGEVDIIKRRAILHLLDSPGGVNLREPWLSAWWLIKESWKEPNDNLRMLEVEIERLQSGERSEALVSDIVDLVAPRLSIEAYESWQHQSLKLPKRPKTFHDLFRATLASEDVVDPDSLGLQELTEGEFIVSLANALEDAVMCGLDITRRIGGGRVEDRVHYVAQYERDAGGVVNRVYYVAQYERGEGTHEPDEHNRGIAPSVKLLHAVVSRLVDIDYPAALTFISRWKQTDFPIHWRLWAAMSCDSRITPASEVGDFLLCLDNKVFWTAYSHPEIAELRARRFSEFDDATQKAITRRIRRRPPRNLWSKNAEADRIEEDRLRWVVRELKRIEVAGATLPRHDKIWLESNIVWFPDLVEMNRIDKGFRGSPKVQDVSITPDRSLDSLEGIERLRALEQKFSAPRRGWDDNLAEQALDWIEKEGNSGRVLRDMESSPDGGAEFPKVWENFGWVHSPLENRGQETHVRDLSAEARRVLDLLAKLPNETLSEAIGGISHWLSCWEEYVVAVPNWSAIWLCAWPLAVENTNAMQPSNEEPDLNVVLQSDSEGPHDLDTLNTPAGKLVGVFLAACQLEENPRPFDDPSGLGKVREHVINASGYSGLIAKQLMIEPLKYFLRADQKWTEKHLIEPLRADDTGARALWRAVGRRTQFTDVLRIIGNDMVDRATDGRDRLGRETRRSLAFSLVIESLHALREGRNPAVEQDRIQQMIRLLDDEVRTYCAEAITRFVNDLSEAGAQEADSLSPEHLFQSSVQPFLQHVWPQERSLVSPGISNKLSRLPAITRGEFAEAVDTIKRFLVPFYCWSMDAYGLYGDDDGTPKLAMIDDEAKAKALLRLLHLTVGMAENATIPYGLGEALEQVRVIVPNLARTPEYRRLETAARRV